jgi:LacI family gluconate utilization system Gnt-I transcriptional repressor
MAEVRTRGGRPSGRVRLKDVARLAAVAPITVSRALQSPGRVSAEARLRIDAAIAATGYVPDLVAQSLVSNRTGMVGVVIPTIVDSIYASTIAAMSEVLRAHRAQLLLGDSGYSLAEEEAIAGAFLARRADALVLSTVAHTDRLRRLLSRAGVPVVETGNLTAEPIDMVVGLSNERAAFDMTRYLVERGHRAIGFIGAETGGNPQASDRQAGYRRALAASGLPLDERLVIEAPRELDGGSAALRTLLERGPGLDAVFAAGEVWAVGALLECLRRGVTVPARLAIAGFNDEMIAGQLVPPLTTVRIPRAEIGRRAAQMVVDRLRGRAVAPTTVDVGYEIVRRATA